MKRAKKRWPYAAWFDMIYKRALDTYERRFGAARKRTP